MIKFIHTADIHLDSPLRGLERYEGAPVNDIRLATRRALENLVNLALEEQVKFVLISGDIYDGDWKDYNTGLFFIKIMSQLSKENIPVFIISGNHDASSQITKNLRLPDQVQVFSDQSPETLLLNELEIAIHGQSFPQRVVLEDLTTQYPPPLTGYFNIGMLHTSATGRPGHEPYAPCTVQGLTSKGYDYWALGHVHTREILHENPWIVFPGNIQGRHIRETGAKGCTLVTLEDKQIVDVQHRDLDVFRWGVCEVSVADAETPEVVLEQIDDALQALIEDGDKLPWGVRLYITGSCPAHTELTGHSAQWTSEIRAMANDHNIWIEKTYFRTTPEYDLAELQDRNDPLGGLLRTLDALSDSDEVLTELSKEFKDLQRKIPLELQEGNDPIELSSPEKLREYCHDIKHFLIPQLLSQTSDE